MRAASILVILLILAIGWAEDSDEKRAEKSDVEIIYLRVQSTIQARFATTIITSQLANKASSSNMVTFTAQLPDSAFMSNFSMRMDDKTIYGKVKEKEEAKADFDAAKARGESTGLVAKAPRETNTFTISVNVEARSKVVFNVTYQELLKRVHGVYKHIINLQTEQPVSELKVDVYVTEKGEIKGLKVPKFEEKAGEKTNKELLEAPAEPNVQIKQLAKEKDVNSYHIHFEPKSKEIYNGQLVVLYDVKRDQTGGEVEVVDGYFVHFFAPQGLKKRPKDIIFVLDKSGSMEGRKMAQLKDAMKVILKDLDSEDNFQILFFSDSVEPWRDEVAKATSDNVKAAIRHVEDTEADGGTNIYDSLQEGLKIFKKWRSPSVPMILFLTDGQPTVGETTLEKIIDDTTTSNTDQKVIIHGIAFGEDADYDLLRKISSRNRGLAKRVYEDSDAALQLEGFYDQISSPILTELKIDYLNETVDASTIVQDTTHNYYDGDEVVVVGKTREGAPSKSGSDPKPVRAKIVGQGSSGVVAMEAYSSRPIICPLYEYPIWYDGGIIVQPRIRPDIWCCPPPYCCWWRSCPPPPHPRPIPTPPPKEPLPSRTVGGFLERVWAYQTIKKLLKDMDLKDSSSERREAKRKALDMCLKYNFVTELTSMVVVKPDEDKPDVLHSREKDKEKGEAGKPLSSSSSAGGRGAGGPVALGKQIAPGGAAGFGGIAGGSNAAGESAGPPLAAAGPPPPPAPSPPRKAPEATDEEQRAQATTLAPTTKATTTKSTTVKTTTTKATTTQPVKTTSPSGCNMELVFVKEVSSTTASTLDRRIGDYAITTIKTLQKGNAKIKVGLVAALSGDRGFVSHDMDTAGNVVVGGNRLKDESKVNTTLTQAIDGLFRDYKATGVKRYVVFLIPTTSIEYAVTASRNVKGHGVGVYAVPFANDNSPQFAKSLTRITPEASRIYHSPPSDGKDLGQALLKCP